jgi:hypothetical protein
MICASDMAWGAFLLKWAFLTGYGLLIGCGFWLVCGAWARFSIMRALVGFGLLVWGLASLMGQNP